MKFPIDKSIKNNHHQRPYFDHIPIMPRIIFKIILVSAWTCSVVCYATLRMPIIVTRLPYSVFSLCCSMLSSYLHHLLDNIMFIPRWIAHTMWMHISHTSYFPYASYDCVLNLHHKPLRQCQIWISFITTQLNHEMNDQVWIWNQPYAMASNNNKVCVIIYRSSMWNNVSIKIIFLGLFIIILFQSNPIINIQFLLILIIYWPCHPHSLSVIINFLK